jgi:hypothetical protein
MLLRVAFVAGSNHARFERIARQLGYGEPSVEHGTLRPTPSGRVECVTAFRFAEPLRRAAPAGLEPGLAP